MRSRIALLAAGLLAGTVASALPARAAEVAGAVFTMTNSALGGNDVVAYERRSDGSLRLVGAFPTGGTGSGPAPTSTVLGVKLAATADPLGSQGSLILSGDNRLLFAVNAGSDSVSCFRVNADGPGPLLGAARTAASGGTFPVSLTFRADRGGGGVLYVLNSGGRGGITGFRVGADCSLSRIQGGRNGSLYALIGDPPFPDPEPNEPLTTASQIGFTPDGRRLVVTIKGGPVEGAAGLPTGDIVVFDVDPAGRLAGRPAVTALAGRQGQAGPFGFTFDEEGRLLVNLAFSNSFATYEIGRSGGLGLVGGPLQLSNLQDGTVLSAGAVNCWVVRRGDTLYVMSIGDNPVTNGGLPDGPGVISALRVRGDGSLRPLPTTRLGARGVVAVLPQDDRAGFDPDDPEGLFGNHGIDLALAEDGGRAFLYAIEPRVGQIGAWEVNRDGTLRFIRNFDGRIPAGADPFAGTNPGILDFLEFCFLQDRRDLSPECRRGSAQGIAAF